MQDFHVCQTKPASPLDAHRPHSRAPRCWHYGRFLVSSLHFLSLLRFFTSMYNVCNQEEVIEVILL